MGNHIPDAELTALMREVAREVIGEQPAAEPGGFAADVLDLEQLRNLPKPVPLIEGTLDMRTVVLLAGPWGSGKSFIALDWMLSVASGFAWLGRSVKQTGRVLYVAAEGAHGLAGRVDAWAAWKKDVPPGMFYVYPKPVNLLDGRAVHELCLYVMANGIMCVVFDTLARCLVGGDENSAKDMGIAIDNAYRVRRNTVDESGVVLLVHHMGKDRATVRGSSALEAGVDCAYAIEGDAGYLKLTRTKRKDGPRDDQVHLRLKESHGSCVVEGVHPGADMSPRTNEVLSIFVSTFATTGASKAEWRRVAEECGIRSSGTFTRAVNSLVEQGVLTNVGTHARPFYQLSQATETAA